MLARRRREAERLESHRQTQNSLRENIVLLGKQAIEIYCLMPSHLIKADSYIDQAEADFADGAFAPFLRISGIFITVKSSELLFVS